MKSKKKITAEQFDAKFEAGEDMSEHVDWDNATRRFNLDLPVWSVKELDDEAKRQGQTRQGLVRMIVIAHLDAIREKKRA